MPTDDEFRQLQQQVQNLANQLNAARNRIDELEDFATDHIGLDWGESLVDINAPHPNMSVNTLESGGGTVRQDVSGMQIYVPATPALAGSQSLWFVPQLLPNPLSQATEFCQIEGYISTGSDDALNLSATSSQADASKTMLEIASGGNSGSNFGFVRVSFAADSAGAYNEPLLLMPHQTWIGEQVYFIGDVTPAQITSNQDNYNPTALNTASALRLTSDAARDITGIAGGQDGRILLILNIGSFNIVLKDETTSTAANRFALAADITLAPDNSALLWYDGTSSRWRCVARYT